MPNLSAMPAAFSRGTTVIYTKSVPDYPPSAGWALTLYLAGVAVFSKAATASGESYVVTLTATETAALATGDYVWTERVAKSPEVYDVASGQVTVAPNVATAAAGELQSFEEKALVIVEAALLASAGSNIVTYQLHGRGVTRQTREQAEKYRDTLKLRIQKRRNGGQIGHRTLVSFRRP